MAERAAQSPQFLAELDELTSKILARSPGGLTANRVRLGLPRSHRVPLAVLTKRLETLVQEGRLHTWTPPAGRPRPPATVYSTVALDHWITDQVIQELTTRPSTQAELKQRIPGPLRALLREILGRLLVEKRVFQHPPVKGRRFLSLEPPDAAQALSRELTRLFDKARRLGFSLEDVAAALRRFTTRHVEDEDVILDAMVNLKPASARGALVYLPDLRRRLQDRFRNKQEFDRAILSLAEKGRVQLQSHSLPASLNEVEREAMIDNGRGSYYMAIGIRAE
jgi:hypothetical protein